MPAAIAGYFFVAGTIGYAVVYAVVALAINYGLAALSQSLAGKPRKPSGDGNQSPASRDVNVRGTTEFGQVVYGELPVSGYIAFIGVNGAAAQVLYFVVVVANHQVESITDCWLDDRMVPNGDIVSGVVTTPAFVNSQGSFCLKIHKYLGTHNQTVDTDLSSAFPEWTSDHRGAGVAYVVFELAQDATDKVWAGGAPQNLRSLVKGKRVYDPRLDSTNGGSGSQRYTDATTWAWSNNPALIARDYITGGSYWFSLATPQNLLGIREPNARLNDTYTIAAANICDQQVNIPLGFALTSNLTVSGTGLTRTVTKINGAGWTDRAYFSQAMSSITLTLSFANTTTNVMVGLDAHPQDSVSYTTIDFAWTYSTVDGALAIYENGVKIGNYGSYIVGTTTLQIVYSGGTITYKKNGVNQRTTSASVPLFVTSSFLETPSSFTATLAACTQNRYTCDTQLSCGDTHLTNMTTLLSAMSGHIAYVNGKYRLYAGAYDAPTITLTADDVHGDMELITHPTGDEVYNYVTGTFYDEDRNWAVSTFPAQTQSSYQIDDGALYTRSIDLRATRQNYRAQRIANVVLNQSRNKISINFSALSPTAINISEWETFYLTLPEYGYNAQVFRCLQWKFLQSGLIGMTARIESASAYNDPAITDYTDPASNAPPTSSTDQPQIPTALSLGSFPTYIRAIITLPGVLRKGEIVEVWEHTSSSPFSSATKILEGAATAFQFPKRDTTTRYYWVRTRLNGQLSSTYPASTGSSAAADLTQTADIANNGATLVQEGTATGLSFSGTFFASGPTINSDVRDSVIEMTITFTLVVNTFVATDSVQVDFSLSGYGGVATSDDLHPVISVSNGNSQSVSFHATVVHNSGSAGQLHVSFVRANLSNTYTINNLVARTTEVFK
jgi:hypothetical protein